MPIESENRKSLKESLTKGINQIKNGEISEEQRINTILIYAINYAGEYARLINCTEIQELNSGKKQIIITPQRYFQRGNIDLNEYSGSWDHLRAIEEVCIENMESFGISDYFDKDCPITFSFED